MKNSLPIALIATASAVLSMSAQAATAVAAEMNLKATAEVDGGYDINTSFDAWGPILGSLSMGTLAFSSNGEGSAGFAQGFGNAGWDSANKGAVSFEGYGWSFSAAGASSAAAALTGGGSDWQYSFIAGSTDVQFKMAYDVFGSGATFGLWGWSIIVDGGPQGSQALYVSNANDPTANGVFSAVLTAGSAYTARLVNNANISNSQTGFDAEGFMNGNFQWEIVSLAVPEPGTYALMALGLVAVGAVARRRRA